VVSQALARIWVPGWKIDPGFFGNSYLVAWCALLDTFHVTRPELQHVLLLDQKVDFIFDERMEKKKIIPMWDQYVADKGEPFRKLFGATPRFEDDKHFLPIVTENLIRAG